MRIKNSIVRWMGDCLGGVVVGVETPSLGAGFGGTSPPQKFHTVVQHHRSYSDDIRKPPDDAT